MNDINYIDLFSGIGGFALGARWSGMTWKHHFNSDIEEYALKVYAKRFPESISLGDITKIDTRELLKYGSKWIITGGFPCQDISIAGKGAGLAGARSGLWFEYWRLIRDLRPQFAIMENVGALTFRGLDRVLGSLAEIGYNAEWQDIRASDVGRRTGEREYGLLPTPTATDYKGGRKSHAWRSPRNSYKDYCRQVYGMIRPSIAMTEAMMGYPLRWTDLNA